MDGTSPLVDCQPAGVPAMSDHRARSVHQSKDSNGPEKLRWQQPCSISGAVAQFFHQCLSGPAEELVVFALLFAEGVALSLRLLEDCPRLFPSDRRSR